MSGFDGMVLSESISMYLLPHVKQKIHMECGMELQAFIIIHTFTRTLKDWYSHVYVKQQIYGMNLERDCVHNSKLIRRLKSQSWKPMFLVVTTAR